MLRKPLSVMYESEFFQNNNPSSEMTKITQRIRRVISSVQKPLMKILIRISYN